MTISHSVHTVQNPYKHSNLAGTFTLFFSWYMGLEGVTYGKILGILACFLGAVCVGLNDTESGDSKEHSMIGDIVALLAALGYGLYTTVIRYKVKRAFWLKLGVTCFVDFGSCLYLNQLERSHTKACSYCACTTTTTTTNVIISLPS
jgi:drug/metabolite transporter (DMT)-like permease